MLSGDLKCRLDSHYNKFCVRLSTETQTITTTYESEVRRLTEEVAGRDKTVTELTTELERVRQEMSELTNRYHTALQH